MVFLLLLFRLKTHIFSSIHTMSDSDCNFRIPSNFNCNSNFIFQLRFQLNLQPQFHVILRRNNSNSYSPTLGPIINHGSDHTSNHSKFQRQVPPASSTIIPSPIPPYISPIRIPTYNYIGWQTCLETVRPFWKQHTNSATPVRVVLLNFTIIYGGP